MIKPAMDMVRAISITSRIAHKRSMGDFLADRIVQAATERTLLAFGERLAKLMDADSGEIFSETLCGFTKAATGTGSASVLEWFRQYPRVAAMLCMLKQEDYLEAIQTIEVETSNSTGSATPNTDHDINIRITCLSPLAHGSDTKAGNATIFRRMQVLSTQGGVLNLPFYAGNALRGQMRDLLADDFVRALGLEPRKDRPPLSLWFFHALYAGGALEENSSAEKALKKMLGGNGAVKARGIYQFRNTLPGLSLLGCALGNRILAGRARFADLRPSCRQWGNGDREAGELFEWTYLTRREDHEEHEEHHGMIANTECLKAGTVLIGGIDVDMHAMPLERSALGRGLELLVERSHIGAENRRGLGRVEISSPDAPDPEPYKAYLADQKQTIISYLSELGAIDACDGPDSKTPSGKKHPVQLNTGDMLRDGEDDALCS
jgi:hypothetical protein